MIRSLVKRVVAHPSNGSAHVMSSISNACRETCDFAIMGVNTNEHRHLLSVQYPHIIEVIDTHIYIFIRYTPFP